VSVCAQHEIAQLIDGILRPSPACAWQLECRAHPPPASMYATESSTRDVDGGPDLHQADMADESAVDPTVSRERSWTSRVEAEGEDEGGRGGATTVESPFKDPHQLQPQPAQGLTRLPSFATLTFPLNRNGTPATTSNVQGTLHADGASASPAGAVANAHAGPSQLSPTTLAAQQIAQSSNYGNYYAPGQTNGASSSTDDPNLLIDTSGLGPYDEPNPADLDLGDLGAAVEAELAAQQDADGGLNPSLKRAREGDDQREGSASSTGGGSGSPKSGRGVTTQKTKDAGITRRKVDARFSCPVEGCGSTFTRSVGTYSRERESSPSRTLTAHSSYHHRSHNLTGHLRSHADERPFKCEVCGRGFARCVDASRGLLLATARAY
jgi:hypothetical protein